MATQITFTDDVGRISTASNADGSIRWHVYERPFGNGISIFVQREVNTVLEAEVRLLAEGDRPEIFFDPVTSKFLFFYRLNENVFKIEIDEGDPPATQAPQVGTTIDHFRGMGGFSEETRTIREILPENQIGLGPIDADNGPTRMDAVAVVASQNLGKIKVRWRAKNPDSEGQTVAGFNVYGQLFDAGRALLKLNGSLIPFEGFDPKLYEFEVPARGGRYFVTQVNRKGADPTFVEGRIKPPFGDTLTNGVTLPEANTSIMNARQGESIQPEDLKFVFVDTAPLTIIRADTFPGHARGDSFNDPGTEIVVEYVVVLVSDGATFPIDDQFKDVSTGEGFVAKINIDQQGGVIIG